MKLRVGLLLIAVATAFLGTMLLGYYMRSIRREALAGQEPVRVFVATRSVERGPTLRELVERGWVKKAPVPRRYTADGAIRSLRGPGNRFLAVPLQRGQQLTDTVLSRRRGRLQAPRGKIAVSVPIDDVALMGGHIRAGDRVAIFVTLKPGRDGKNLTRILLPHVLVLATSKESNKGAPGTGQTAKSSLTVAVAPRDAEKLVFAAEEGRIWTGLWRPDAKQTPATPGTGLDSLF